MNDAHQQLACLFNVLTKYVSKVDYMVHKSLLGELLGMNVWVVSKVSTDRKVGAPPNICHSAFLFRQLIIMVSRTLFSLHFLGVFCVG